MRKHTEKQPIDDLFARKLGNMSLPPSADGFKRLQARMGKSEPEAKIVFWRNPAVYGYTAAAACLLLVCLFGWLYWPSSGPTDKLAGSQVAIDKRTGLADRNRSDVGKSDIAEKKGTDATVLAPTNEETPVQSAQPEQLAQNQPIGSYSNSSRGGQIKRETKTSRTNRLVETNVEQPILTQTKPIESKTKAVDVTAQPVVQPIQSEPSIAAVNKPTPAVERGLVVTIAEPEAMVAAREVAKASVEEKEVVASANKVEKEPKSGNLWQQMKRLKQGDVLARGDNAETGESSLLSRAYSGLKHSIEKDKSAKQ